MGTAVRGEGRRGAGPRQAGSEDASLDHGAACMPAHTGALGSPGLGPIYFARGHGSDTHKHGNFTDELNLPWKHAVAVHGALWYFCHLVTGHTFPTGSQTPMCSPGGLLNPGGALQGNKVRAHLGNGGSQWHSSQCSPEHCREEVLGSHSGVQMGLAGLGTS